MVKQERCDQLHLEKLVKLMEVRYQIKNNICDPYGIKWN